MWRQASHHPWSSFDAIERYGTVRGQAIDDILLAGDGIHPNEAGQRLVCQLLTAQIIELLTPGAVTSDEGPIIGVLLALLCGGSRPN